jgi:hypothetical protein
MPPLREYKFGQAGKNKQRYAKMDEFWSFVQNKSNQKLLKVFPISKYHTREIIHPDNL